MSAGVSLVGRTGHPDFLDLPWTVPLEAWVGGRLVDVARGVSRHVVRFVAYDDRVYALKETTRRLAVQEYALLRRLTDDGLPAVEAVGVVTGRTDDAGAELPAVLVTRFLPFSLPYRYLFTSPASGGLRDRLLDALAALLVRLHLAGFHWGDCSLSNVLFRRDAGALAAYLVDAETGSFSPTLNPERRAHDVEVAVENVYGELLDLEASGTADPGVDADACATGLLPRYEALWDELHAEVVARRGERSAVEAGIARLNRLGFDVEEFELVASGGGDVRLTPRVVEEGHHNRRLRDLTGFCFQENQARRLLNDVTGYRAHLARAEGQEPPPEVAAYRWRTEVFEPVLAAIPPEQRGKLEPPELFHEFLEHRWYLSQRAGRDVGDAEAVASYVDTVLATRPSEAALP